MLPIIPPKHRVVIFDCETYYDRDYSLKKMPTPNYILDQRFEMQIVATKVDDGPHTIVHGPDFGAWLSQFDPALTTTVSFNSLFDNSILSWKYGFVPHTMIDVMGMWRDEIIGRRLMPAFERYALDDNIICEDALKKLYPNFPRSERRIMDL